MVPRLTIEDRLMIFAEGGITNGFTLRLWKDKAKKLEKEGIVLRNPVPTGRSGETKYEIDFSVPMPGTFSEQLYEIAVVSGKNESTIEAGTINHPYEVD